MPTIAPCNGLPLVTQYRGYQIVGFPPPSSGGVHVAQILGILEEFNMAELYRDNPVTATHVMAEAMELAFADRAYWLGDADFVDVPRGLVAKPYLKMLAEQIDLEKDVPVKSHGDPPDAQLDLFSQHHTTHLCGGGRGGLLGRHHGDGQHDVRLQGHRAGTGVFLNNEMDDFSIHPGVPNAFGLVGAENNAVAPGKRPLSSMSPTLVLQGQRTGVNGRSRGRSQDYYPSRADHSAVSRFWVCRCEMPWRRPRLHHQWRPDRLMLERDFPEEIADALREMGHQTRTISSGGVCQAIARSEDGKLLGGQ